MTGTVTPPVQGDAFGAGNTVDTMRRAMPSRLQPPVGAFSDRVLAQDLPDLASDRRAEVVAFVERRVASMPSPMRTGVSVAALAIEGGARLVGADRLTRLLVRRPFPITGEYVRLVRSLSYAYIWETWPDTTPTGGRP
jgi:hypothetical protein